jgi:hypothetical protein
LSACSAVTGTASRPRAFYQSIEALTSNSCILLQSLVESCDYSCDTFPLLNIALDKMATNRAPFPSNPDDFDSDTRISYSKATKNYTLEDENGEEWEWFPRTSKWVPMVRNSR